MEVEIAKFVASLIFAVAGIVFLLVMGWRCARLMEAEYAKARRQIEIEFETTKKAILALSAPVEQHITTNELRRLLSAPGDGAAMPHPTRFTGEGGIRS